MEKLLSAPKETDGTFPEWWHTAIRKELQGNMLPPDVNNFWTYFFAAKNGVIYSFQSVLENSSETQFPKGIYVHTNIPSIMYASFSEPMKPVLFHAANIIKSAEPEGLMKTVIPTEINPAYAGRSVVLDSSVKVNVFGQNTDHTLIFKLEKMNPEDFRDVKAVK